MTTTSPHLTVRPGWLARAVKEPILEPDLPIVDPHHHLWRRAGYTYLARELLDDTASGHRIDATVYVQSRSMMRAHGPAHERAIGEVEFANGAAAIGASGTFGATRICAGIVGGADLSLGDAVEPVLDAMHAVSSGRLCGVRHALAWHADPAVASTTAQVVPHLMDDATFRRGAACAARRGLSLDVWVYHTQLDELYALAHALPKATIVIDHLGGPLGVGSFAGDDARRAMRTDWARAMQRLATLPNTRVKLGGGGMPVFGFAFDTRPSPPDSTLLADAMRPYVEPCIEWFGVERCMFESNFPVDKGMFSYATVWNAFKRLAAHASADEKARLFAGTAREVYDLDRRSDPAE